MMTLFFSLIEKTFFLQYIVGYEIVTTIEKLQSRLAMDYMIFTVFCNFQA